MSIQKLSLVLSLFTSIGATSAFAVEPTSASQADSIKTNTTNWLRIPVVVRPIEKVTLRDYRGQTSESYVNHPVTTKVLKIRVGQSNELYFGPWRFHVDASRVSRAGGVDLSFRLSHINPNTTEAYYDLGQRQIDGRAMKEGSTLRFVSNYSGRFSSPESNITADVEIGGIDEALHNTLSAMETITNDATKVTSSAY